jgi:UDP-glucose 4-epimerase
VLHFAAKSLVGESTRDPGPYWRTNVGGTRALLDAMREHDVPRIVFSSTAATYGEPAVTPITEAEPTRPSNPYGASKLAVDLMLTGEASAHGIAAVSLRYFNVAGAWQGLGERHTTETHLIPLALQAAFGSRDDIEVYGADHPTTDGTCVRDYIHVADLARAHLLAPIDARQGSVEANRTGESCATPTTSSSWFTETDTTSRVCARTSQVCWHHSGYGSPGPRPRSCTCARGSTSSASASSGNARGAPTSGTCTPSSPTGHCGR